MNKLFSRCKKLYRSLYERPIEYFAYPFTAIDPAVGKSSSFVVEGFVNSEGQIFIGKFYKLKEDAIKTQFTIGLKKHIKQWSNLNKENNNMGLSQTPNTTKAEKVAPPSFTEKFASEIVDAVSNLYASLDRVRDISRQLDNFSDTVEQKFLNPGN